MNINGIILILLGLGILLLILPARSLGTLLKIIAIISFLLLGVFLIYQGIIQLQL